MDEQTPTIDMPVLRVRQNVGDIFVGVLNARDLLLIASVDRIRLQEIEVPRYAGYQRALDERRVQEIRDYLATPRSTFPNAIIISIDSDFIANWDDVSTDFGIDLIRITASADAVRIIDGQHRAAALDGAPPDFQVVVAAFVDLSVAQSAEIFAKINSTQKAVNPSIAFQLFGYSEDRSPQRTAHEIAEILNTTEGSPFYRRLRMLGTKDAWAMGSLSQAALSKQLMRLYSRKPLHDQNRLLRSEPLDTYPGYPLRELFREGRDREILQIAWKFFLRVAETWREQWFDDTGTSILPKTTGYTAFIEVLRRWLLSDRAQEVFADKGVAEALAGIRDSYETREKKFTRSNYPAGNQGVQLLRNSLISDLGLGSPQDG